jgi:hypothetical protein
MCGIFTAWCIVVLRHTHSAYSSIRNTYSKRVAYISVYKLGSGGGGGGGNDLGCVGAGGRAVTELHAPDKLQDVAAGGGGGIRCCAAARQCLLKAT